MVKLSFEINYRKRYLKYVKVKQVCFVLIWHHLLINIRNYYSKADFYKNFSDVVY